MLRVALGVSGYCMKHTNWSNESDDSASLNDDLADAVAGNMQIGDALFSMYIFHLGLIVGFGAAQRGYGTRQRVMNRDANIVVAQWSIICGYYCCCCGCRAIVLMILCAD